MASVLRRLFNRTPVPYAPASSGKFSIPWLRPSGQEAQMRAMGSVGTLFAIVNRTSNATSQVEWRLYRKPSTPDGERVEVTRHAALDLWNRPNPFYTRQAFIEAFQQHIDLTGEGWWIVARNGRSSLPLELWFARPDRMQPVPSPTDFITGYVYTGPAGEQVPLETRDVIFLRTPNPLDPYRGMGAVQTVLADLDSTRYSAEWNRNFFLNGAEPGGIIEVDKRLSDTEFNELRDRWNESHKGVSNAHRIAILEQGRWVERKFTQRDMQFQELRQQSSEFIREAFGFPKPMLGTVEDVNRANAEAAAVVFARWLIVPRLERIKQALNSGLLPLYGPEAAEGLEFDYDNPVPEDEEAQAAELEAKTRAAKNMIDSGFYGPEVLTAFGLPEVSYGQPNADKDRELLITLVTGAPTLAPIILPLLGFDLTPAAPAPATPPAPPPPAARLDIHHHAQAQQLTAPGGSLFDLQRPRQPRAQAAGDAELEDVRADYEQALEDIMGQWDDIENTWYEGLEDQIRTAVDRNDAGALGAMAVPSEQAVGTLRRALAGMAEQAAGRMVEEAAAQGVKITAPRLAKELRASTSTRHLTNAFGADLVGVAQVTADLLASGVAAAAGREALRLFQPGSSGREVAAAAIGALRGLKNWFRRDQLGGALHRAQNTGRIAVLEAAPKATYTATEKHDSNTCPPCGKIDGTVLDDLAAVRAAYGSGGYVGCEGGIRCRGTVVATWA